MNNFEYFNPKKTMKLFHMKDKFIFFKELMIKENFPKIILLSGDKGLGKSTLLNHLLHYYFNPKNYDLTKNYILQEDAFFKKYNDNSFSNILYLNNEDIKNIKIDDIRKLKNNLSKTSIYNAKRFIVMDDVETLNLNSSNALLKILEDRNENNYFFLINNKTKPLIETIKSRCIEFKIFINNDTLTNITESLLNHFDQKQVFTNNSVKVSPGNFLKFNYIFKENKINPNDNLIKNLSLLINIYKNEKSFFFKELFIFLIENNIKINKDLLRNNSFINKRIDLIENVNNFFIYNLNQKTFLNNLEKRIYE